MKTNLHFILLSFSLLLFIEASSQATFNLKIFLEGPFNGTSMNTDLNVQNLIPLNQPYNTAPWNYNGTELVPSIPNSSVVDWVLIELRETTGDANSATPDKIINRQVAFLRSDGQVVGLDGTSYPIYSGTVTANLYVIIRHRNHLAMMSSGTLSESGGVYTWDFTDQVSKAYLNGQKEIAPGIYGMKGGDCDGSGHTIQKDKSLCWEDRAGFYGYFSSDLNLDGQVDNDDKDRVYVPNIGQSAQLPEGIVWECGMDITDSRDGQIYSTVQIGEQCWMAENLNIGTMINVIVPMTDNGTIEKYCQNNSVDSCIEYGGLYQWNEMMRYSTSGKGICPMGWHVSTDEEFIELTQYLGGGDIAGNKMKETGYRHWYSPNDGSTNSSGFTALGGGFTDPAGTIYEPGGYCDFWISTGDNPENGMRWWLANGYPGIGHDTDYPKGFGFSVRCVRDTLQATWSCGDPLIDTRDNQSYNTVQIGEQCWMAENLNIGNKVSPNGQLDNGIFEKQCYGEISSNCDTYGGLYQWPEAMQYVTTEGAQGICPEGWQIPEEGDWTILEDFLGGSSVAGGKMKSTGTIEAGTGLWYAPNTGANNESAFTGLPGGIFGYNSGTYSELGNSGYFWSSSQYSSSNAWWHGMYNNWTGIEHQAGSTANGFSVRCIKACSPEPTQSNAGPDQLNISGISTLLAGNTPLNGTGLWSVVAGTGGTIINPTSPTSEFQGVAGNEYTLAWTITTSCGSSSDNVVISFGTVSFTCGNSLLYESQSYATVQIGTQCWMAQNLNVGTQVNPYEQSNNGIIEKLCYDNNASNCNTYGGLYEWNEMMNYSTNQTNQGICPTGWRVPKLSEWETMISYLGGASVAGGKLKETGFTHWNNPNTGATNESGFNAFGSGKFEDGYGLLNMYANYWTSFFNGEDQLLKYVRYNAGSIESGYAYYEYRNAGSVRCIRDEGQ